MTMKKITKRAGVAGAAAVAVAAGGFGLTAIADETNPSPSFAPYTENEDPKPLAVTEGLVYHMGAQYGWQVDDASIDDVPSLAYTVAESTGYAPAFYLVVDEATLGYARLAWEPSVQTQDFDNNADEYTDLQDGLWWSKQITTGEGSASSPMPLEFFQTGGGAGWEDVTVTAIDVKQGSTTESTSVVTDVKYNGVEVPLGNKDTTPFDKADIDKAVAPLAAYKATHSVKDGTSIGTTSQVTLKSTPTVGKYVGVNVKGTIANSDTVKYQWYVSGVAQKNQTKSTFKVPASAKGKTVTVKVTGESKDIVFGVVSNGIIAK